MIIKKYYTKRKAYTSEEIAEQAQTIRQFYSDFTNVEHNVINNAGDIINVLRGPGISQTEIEQLVESVKNDMLNHNMTTLFNNPFNIAEVEIDESDELGFWEEILPDFHSWIDLKVVDFF